MSVITFDESLDVISFSWGERRNDINFESGFGTQALEIMPPLWVATFESPPLYESESNEWKALMMNLKGKVNQLALWNLARPTPLGTMRGTMTLNTAATQGDTSISIIASGESSKTLLKGDYIGIGSGLTQQVVMGVEDATSDGSGVIQFTFQPPLRNAHSVSTSVIWDKPKALFRSEGTVSPWGKNSNIVESNIFDFIEDVRP